MERASSPETFHFSPTIELNWIEFWIQMMAQEEASAKAKAYDDLSEAEREVVDKAEREREAREQAGPSSSFALSWKKNENVALPYKWKQTLQDLDVHVPVPAGTRSKQLDVQLQKQFLRVALKGQPQALMEVSRLKCFLFERSLFHLHLQGDLSHAIKVDESTWMLGKLKPSTLFQRSPPMWNFHWSWKRNWRFEWSLYSFGKIKQSRMVGERVVERSSHRHQEDPTGKLQTEWFGRRNTKYGREDDGASLLMLLIKRFFSLSLFLRSLINDKNPWGFPVVMTWKRPRFYESFKLSIQKWT